MTTTIIFHRSSITDTRFMFRKTRMKSITEGCSLINKTCEFFRVQKQSQDRYEQNLDSSTIDSLEFQIILDSEEKHHSAKIYGIIDAIGTLGGVHEIVLWCIMLIYGSFRKNMYLFSIINRLIQTEQLQDTSLQGNEERRDDNQMLMNTHNQANRQSTNRLNNGQAQNYTPIHRSEIDILPRMI